MRASRCPVVLRTFEIRPYISDAPPMDAQSVTARATTALAAQAMNSRRVGPISCASSQSIRWKRVYSTARARSVDDRPRHRRIVIRSPMANGASRNRVDVLGRMVGPAREDILITLAAGRVPRAPNSTPQRRHKRKTPRISWSPQLIMVDNFRSENRPRCDRLSTDPRSTSRGAHS